MKDLRKHAALAIDGGGIRGTMVAKALSVVERELGQLCNDMYQLTAGTSTGSIISAGIGVGLSATKIHELYVELGKAVFKKNWRCYWPLRNHRYPNKNLKKVLRNTLGEITMNEFWKEDKKMDIVITIRDLVENRTLFVKPWKEEYKKWQLWHAVLCSCAVPTYFPVVDGRYVDGGVGSFSNPCYIAAYEAAYCLNWKPSETTIISIGTGREIEGIQEYEADRYSRLKWVEPILDSFLADASDQQVRLVQRFFEEVDFRRFQIDLKPHVELDDPKGIPALTQLGEKLGNMILDNQVDEKAERESGC